VQYECLNPGHQVAGACTRKFCTLAPNILVSSVYVALLMSKILRSVIGFWKVCGPLAYSVELLL
jgi:hypothetical protein